MEIKIEVEELDDLQTKAMEMNVASTAMLDLIKSIKLKNKIRNKEPAFWKDIGVEEHGDRAKRVAKRSDE